MAVAEHNVSRRALLGAAFALPLAASRRRPGPAFSATPPPTPRWIPDRVRNDEGGGQQDAQSLAVTNSDHEASSPDRHPEPGRRTASWDRALRQLRRAEAALAAAAHEPDDEVYGDILVAFNRALKRLLRAPAPNLPALALKLELASREAAWELTGAETCIAGLAREARRLSLS